MRTEFRHFAGDKHKDYAQDLDFSSLAQRVDIFSYAKLALTKKSLYAPFLRHSLFIFTAFFVNSAPAHAACTPPYTISNGQIADASKVMGDITAVAACADSHNPAGPVNSIQINANGSVLSGVGPLTDGQVLIGATGGAPRAANITAGSGIAITKSSGAITISATGGSGGSSGVLPAIRGSGIQASSASSYVVPWPTGTISGDLAIIFVGGGWEISGAPVGWSLIDKNSGSYWNGSVFAKILTSADISAGSTTVPMISDADSVVSIVTFKGNTTGISSFSSSRNSSGNTVRQLASPPAAGGAMYIYFGSSRVAAPTSISDGTVLQTINDGNEASGTVYSSTAHPFFGSVNFNYAAPGAGDYQAIVAVTGP